MDHVLSRRALLKGAGVIGLAAGTTPLWSGGRALAAAADPQVLATNLTLPWGLVFVGADALVGETRTCDVYRVTAAGGKTRVGNVAGATKLMGMALSPTYAQDRRIYAYVLTVSDLRVVSMTWDGSVLGAPVPVFTGIPAGSDHQGGALVFGPDGKMYVTVGDLDTPALAQDPSSLVGKTLRLNQDGSVPSDNPFGNAVWTLGHRNVEGLAFSGTTLYATEFGDSTTDELNVLVRGGNYGWPTVEGGDGSGPFADPVATWSPTSYCSPSGLAITGGYAYVGALAGQSLFQVDLAAPAAPVRTLFKAFGRIRTVALAPDGSLWVTTGNQGPNYAPVATDDRVVRVLPGAVPTRVVAAQSAAASATLSWAPPANTSPAATGYVVSRDAGTGPGTTTWSTTVAATARSLVFTRLDGGSTYNLSVAAVTSAGTSPAASAPVTIEVGPNSGTPGAPTSVKAASTSSTSATLTWAPPTSTGGSAITGYLVSRDAGSAGGVPWSTTVAATVRSQTFTKLTTGSTYTLSVAAINAAGTGASALVTVVPSGGTATAPGAPVIGTAKPGLSGGAVTATAVWAAPASTGGSAITGYRVRALRMSASGTVLGTTTSAVQPASARSLTMTLPAAGSYRFTAEAVNAVGTSAPSARSNLVAGR